jgi:hypothetical protein
MDKGCQARLGRWSEIYHSHDRRFEALPSAQCRRLQEQRYRRLGSYVAPSAGEVIVIGNYQSEGGVLVAHRPTFTDDETPIRVVHKGFDGFDVAFQGALRPDDIDILEAARTTAELENREVLVEIGPGRVAMHVASTGAKGGYRYRCDTGPIGTTLFFKRKPSRENWNIRISVKSAALAISGIECVWSDLQKLLLDLGINDARESISRVDFALDYLMPKSFSLKSDQFVAHARMTNSEISLFLGNKRKSEEDSHIHFSGRVPTSVTIGKMPNRQIIVYNKRKEAIHRQKYYWFDIWNINRDDDNASIWRVEIRAGKKHLNFWKIKSFLDLENQFGDLAAAAVESVRYVQDIPFELNVSRLPPHPLWHAVTVEINAALFDFRSGIVPERIIEGEKARIAENYKSQLVSLLPGALIANGYTIENAVNNIDIFLASIARRVNAHPEKLQERMRLAAERLHFTVRKTESGTDV